MYKTVIFFGVRMIYVAWFLIYFAWFLIYFAWFLIYHAWFLIYLILSFLQFRWFLLIFTWFLIYQGCCHKLLLLGVFKGLANFAWFLIYPRGSWSTWFSGNRGFKHIAKDAVILDLPLSGSWSTSCFCIDLPSRGSWSTWFCFLEFKVRNAISRCGFEWSTRVVLDLPRVVLDLPSCVFSKK